MMQSHCHKITISSLSRCADTPSAAPELRVLEVNSGVMLESLVRQHPELEPVCADLIKRVVLRMFEEPVV